MSPRWFAWLLPLVFAAFAGCSSSDVSRFDVSGTVTFDGQPVPLGTISFQPVAGNEGPGGFANIKDGKYDTAKDGKGPTGGPHSVSISGFDGNANPDNELPFGAPLFGDYRIEVDLPKESATQNFDVPASAKPQPQRPMPNQKA